jgi:hypothetical protein
VSAVTDQELVLAVLREVGSIIAEHLEAATSDASDRSVGRGVGHTRTR